MTGEIKMETTVQEVVADTKAVYRAAFKAIRAELALGVAEVRGIRKAIHAKKAEPPSEARGRALQELWQEKRLGADTRRSLTLALAYLKERPYATCEQKAVVAPFVGEMARLLTRVGIETSVETLKLWVSPPKVAEEAAA